MGIEHELEQVFLPIQIGNLTLPNRILMGPVITGFEKSYDYDQLARFYGERARGGTALITIGGFSFTLLGAYELGQARFTSHSQVASHRKITEAIHKEGGYALFSLSHAGALAEHFFAVNPHRINHNGRFIFKMPNIAIRKTIRLAAQTALLAKEALYNGVEIDLTQNKLLNSFATPGLNKRHDEWGGSAENRFKITLEMVREIRKKVGEDFVISARLSLMDFHIEGKNWDDTIFFAQELVKAGVNVFSFDFGTNYMNIPIHHGLTPEDAWVPFVEMFSQEVSVPVIFGGNLQSPEKVNEVLKRNPHSCVELTRALIVDPFWLKKLAYHAERLIIGCTHCNQGCSPHNILKEGKLHCMMNPTMFENFQEIMQHTDNPKKILVVGAGPAGLATAVFAARRGHSVTIYEAREEIGGQVSFIKKVPGKQKYVYLIDLFRRLCNRFDIKIETNHKVTTRELDEIHRQFDRVVFATGSIPGWIDIQGAPSSKVYQYPDVFKNNVALGNRIVVIGNNTIALDVATYLVHKNSTPPTRDSWLQMWGIGDPRKYPAGVVGVIPKAMTPYRQVALLARDKTDYSSFIQEDFRSFELQWLRILGIKTFTNANFDSYDSTNLHISFGKHHEDPYPIPADHIVICNTPYANDEIAKKYAEAGLNVDIVGAAQGPFKKHEIKTILECLRDGIELGSKI